MVRASRRVVATVAALIAAVTLAALDCRDLGREPTTDTADRVATAAVIVGGMAWFALRRPERAVRWIAPIRSAAGGVALGALVVGLASAVYDPFVR